MNKKFDPIGRSVMVSRLVFGTFGFAFAGIGLSLLGYLWLTPFNDFGSPPLIVRIFGSFIALVFVVMGGTTFLCALIGGQLMNFGEHMRSDAERAAGQNIPPSIPVTYTCAKCGAHLGNQTEVSPLGDVKCSFCHQWFNIHRPSIEA